MRVFFKQTVLVVDKQDLSFLMATKIPDFSSLDEKRKESDWSTGVLQADLKTGLRGFGMRSTSIMRSLERLRRNDEHFFECRDTTTDAGQNTFVSMQGVGRLAANMARKVKANAGGKETENGQEAAVICHFLVELCGRLVAFLRENAPVPVPVTQQQAGPVVPVPRQPDNLLALLDAQFARDYPAAAAAAAAAEKAAAAAAAAAAAGAAEKADEFHVRLSRDTALVSDADLASFADKFETHICERTDKIVAQAIREIEDRRVESEQKLRQQIAGLEAGIIEAKLLASKPTRDTN
jgi:hypothetical protein